MRKRILAVIAAVMVTVLAFTGCGNNEKEASKEIIVISREDGSGTRGAFTELLGIIDENENDITTDTAQITNSTSVMLQKVEQNENAIGYVSLGSLADSVKAIQVDGVDATTDNIKAGNYKVSRPFNICYKEDKLTDLDKDFITFIMSEEGQAIVSEEGYINLDAEGSYEGEGKSGKITLAGSTSVAPLMGKLADAYKGINPDVMIEIQESGSSAGIKSAMDGATEIGMSSRDLKPEEASELAVKKIAIDGIAVITNKSNDITGLTSEQIKGIYVGKITKWDDVK